MSAAAKKIQADREAADLANHRERLIWLEAPSPHWADGTLVDSHTRNALLLQSRTAVAKALGEAAHG